jgi:hypothetical protein
MKYFSKFTIQQSRRKNNANKMLPIVNSGGKPNTAILEISVFLARSHRVEI